jgi:integrase
MAAKTTVTEARGTGLSFKSKNRQAYLSDSFVRTTFMEAYNKKTKRTLNPSWLKSLILTAYYTGMRLGEILYLKRHHVFLNQRMIFFGLEDIWAIKERQPKRIPIHRELMPILKRAFSVTSLEHQEVFLLSDGRGARPITKNSCGTGYEKFQHRLEPQSSGKFSRFEAHLQDELLPVKNT